MEGKIEHYLFINRSLSWDINVLRDQREYRLTDYTHGGYLQKLNLSLRKYTARRRNIQ